MPTICNRCGQPSYVTYVKPNPGSICDVCEDNERQSKGRSNEWKTIQVNNHKYNHHPHKLNSRGNVLYLKSYRKITEKYVRLPRIIKNRIS